VSAKAVSDDNDAPVFKAFNINEARAEEIVQKLEKMLVDDESCLSDVILNIFKDKELCEEERIFSFYAIGFVGGRHVTLNEVANVIGVDRLKYFLDNNDDKKDPMYQ
jgi:hypothetical protein